MAKTQNRSFSYILTNLSPVYKGVIFATPLIIYYLASPWMLVNWGPPSRLFAYTFLVPAALFWGLRVGVIVAVAALIPGFIIHKVLDLSYQGGVLGPISSVLMIAVIGHFRDIHTKLDIEISLRKGAEAELRDHTNNLEDLVKRRTSDLTTTNLELENEIAIRKKAEETLTISERNYQEIFNATNEAIFIHDSGSGAILDVNRTMLEMYGYSHEEALDLNVDDVSSRESPYTGEEAQEFI